jgi:hypothetical protein
MIAMKFIGLSALGVLVILPDAAFGQVHIKLSAQEYKMQDNIFAKVENAGSGAVTFCVEFGQTSSGHGQVENTPSPFWVQQTNDNGKWSTLLIGPDVGSLRGPVVAEARESKEFRFRLNTHGMTRLRLAYWRGSLPDLDCRNSPKDRKVVTSAVFMVRKAD